VVGIDVGDTMKWHRHNLFLAFLDLVGNIGVELVMHLYQRTHVVSIDLKTFLLQVGCSGKCGGDV